jgi:hypothetical protein
MHRRCGIKRLQVRFRGHHVLLGRAIRLSGACVLRRVTGCGRAGIFLWSRLFFDEVGAAADAVVDFSGLSEAAALFAGEAARFSFNSASSVQMRCSICSIFLNGTMSDSMSIRRRRQ